MRSALVRWLLLAGLLATLWSVLRWAPAGAQDTPIRLDLARICVGEAGIQTETGDCAAIVHLLQRRAELRGVTLRHMARAYSGRHVGAEASPRPWIAGLRLDGRQPAEWPASASWARYRAGWLDVVDHVAEVLDGAVPDPCPQSDHWGMPRGIDLERARRAGWRRVECSTRTRNAFWNVPRRRGDGA